ncbi:MAG: hypothetical protein IJP33_03525 [Firmicutes bacterium]|nr:hypothetical protein [Bacillota bacterium]
MASNKQKFNWKFPVLITFITFIIAALLSAYSQSVLTNISVIYIAFILLVFIILIGILFDIIGVAVAAANPAPLHAKASRKIPGATIALGMIKNADRVSNICNDVVGDIAGTLSGGVGAAIAANIIFSAAHGGAWLPSVLMSGVVAALTVGGKAFGKSFAINNADTILFTVGKIIYGLKYIFTFRFLKKR